MDGHGSPRVKNGPALAGHGAEAVRDAIAATIATLPEQLRRSLTWDQGAEMAQHAQLRIDTGLPVYFCDPHSPWQRGTNENTNGLLRQYFPKGTDLSRHSAEDLAAVAAALNSRPRKTLGWRTPAEALDELLHSATNKAVLRRPLEPKLISSVSPVSARICSGSRISPGTAITPGLLASRLRACEITTGSLSTYATRTPGATSWAMSCVFTAVGRPAPTSMNCWTPQAAT